MNSLAVTPCPVCGRAGVLEISVRLFADPIGEFSIAGAQMKVTASTRPVLGCPICGFELAGEFDDDGEHVSFPHPKAD